MPDEGGGQKFAEPLAVSDELRDESGRFEARQFAGQRVGHADEVDLQVVPGLAEPERLGRGCERTSAAGSSALKSSQFRPFRNSLFYLHRFRRASFVALGAPVPRQMPSPPCRAKSTWRGAYASVSPTTRETADLSLSMIKRPEQPATRQRRSTWRLGEVPRFEGRRIRQTSGGYGTAP